MELKKITKRSYRSYDDACGTAHALDLLGERWALLVVRELMLGPRRFGDLRASLPGISANVLTQRLEGLEASGVLRRTKLPPPASVQVYELTEWGLEAEPILMTLGRWATRSPRHDPALPLSAVALMLSFRAKFEPDKTEGLDLAIEFRLGPEAFTVGVRDRRLITERGAPLRSDARVTSTPEVLAGLIYGKVPLAVLEGQGALVVDGDSAALDNFADLFELPAKTG